MDERLQQFETKMEKTCEYLEADFMTIRAGRANPHVLDKIRVDYYGSPTPLQQVGNVTVPEPRMIQIAPWEKSLIKAIEKAIMASDIGITPSNDGNVIRLVFPELYLSNRLDKLFQTFYRQICRLYRNQDAVRTGKGIYRDHAEGWHTINQNIIVPFFLLFYVGTQYRFPAHNIYERGFQTGKLNISRHEIHTFLMS